MGIRSAVAVNRVRNRLVSHLNHRNIRPGAGITDLLRVNDDTERWHEKEETSPVKTPSNTETSPAVADLQNKWSTLNELDRARAVNAIHQAGTSLRSLAKALKCSPSLLRRLLDLLKAPLEDQLLARQGKISSNELVRRSKTAGTLRAARDREVLERKCTAAAQQGCKDICEWLKKENIAEVTGENIVEEARLQLARTEEEGKLPQSAAPPDMPVAEIIRRLRPVEPRPHEISKVGWYAFWLACWTINAMPDSAVRDKALNLALDVQIKGEAIKPVSRTFGKVASPRSVG